MLVLAALHDPAWQRLGVALIHFVWQGLLIAASYSLWIEVFRVRRAEDRYLGGLIALGLMALCPLVTWALVEAPHAPMSLAGQAATSLSAIGDGGAVAFGDNEVSPPRAIAWVVSFWLTGVGLLSVRILVGLFGISWLTYRGQPISAQLQAHVKQLAHALGLRSAPLIIAHSDIQESLAAGFFRPFIVIPAAWVLEMPPDMLEAVLAHELAHLRRWDLWVNLAQRVVESLLFYHPAVWWLSRQIRLEREMCCDEMAVSATQRPASYASALEAVARRRFARPVPMFTMGMRGVKMALLQRVRNILGLGGATRGALWWPLAGVTLAIILGWWISASRLPASAHAADDEASPPTSAAGSPERDRGVPESSALSADADLLRAVRELQTDMAELRRDVREIRDRRPPPPPPALRALLDALPRDANGRPYLGPPGPAPHREPRGPEATDPSPAPTP